MKVYLYYIGKPRDARANALSQDYIARASRYARCEMREIRPERFDPFERHPDASIIQLDPAGRSLDSAALARLFAEAEMRGRDLVFLTGGATGFPESWRGRAGLLVSLSALTLPHELARVIAAEQIYRAFATLRAHPYPR